LALEGEKSKRAHKRNPANFSKIWQIINSVRWSQNLGTLVDLNRKVDVVDHGSDDSEGAVPEDRLRVCLNVVEERLY
jgi:predicted helicase